VGFSGAVAAPGLLAAKSLLHWLQNCGQVCPSVFPAFFRPAHWLLQAFRAGDLAAKDGNGVRTRIDAVAVSTMQQDLPLMISSDEGF
jgi:hypothetical protein